jgi:hypothetical protein
MDRQPSKYICPQLEGDLDSCIKVMTLAMLEWAIGYRNNPNPTKCVSYPILLLPANKVDLIVQNH